MAERKKVLLRLDPAVHDAVARWAGDELRSTNAQIEFLLRRALADAGRLPRTAGRMRRPGRPPKTDPHPDTDSSADSRADSGAGTGDGPREPPSRGRGTSEDE